VLRPRATLRKHAFMLYVGQALGVRRATWMLERSVPQRAPSSARSDKSETRWPIGRADAERLRPDAGTLGRNRAMRRSPGRRRTGGIAAAA
jgi:hypothetical protein